MQTDGNAQGNPGFGYAAVGLLSTCVGMLLLAQAGPYGGDREFFLSVGLLLSAVGALYMMIGAVAIGVRVARGV